MNLFRRLRLSTVVAVAAVATIAGAGVGLIGSSSSGPVAADPSVPAFEAKFDTPSDVSLFDFGFSGLFIPGISIDHYHGDHDMNCGDPNLTSRTVTLSAADKVAPMDFSQAFWYCQPGGDPAKGHLMSAITTTGYNHAWFSPKAELTDITKVCFDVNETSIGGKWIEVQFVDHADATRYPTGTIIADGNAVARGTGGFDLGYTEPGFRPEATGQDSGVGPNNGLQPRSGTLAGLKIDTGASIYTWWQNQDDITAGGVGWPGINANGNDPNQPVITDKAARYTHCLENDPANPNQLIITDTIVAGAQAQPAGGPRTFVIPGHIPGGARRVVFHDAEYDGPKRDGYSPDRLTWHWDNVRVWTKTGGPPGSTTSTQSPTTTAATTTTTAPTTTAQPTTTVGTTTTAPPTTVTSTTSTAPSTTTTTVPAACLPFAAELRSWCQSVEQRLAALGG